MFKVNNKETGTPTYFTPCSSVFIVNSEHVIAVWAINFDSSNPTNAAVVKIYTKVSKLCIRC